MSIIGPTGQSGRNATPLVVLEVAMNTASIQLPSNILVKIPFNFLVFGSELGTRAFNPFTTVITIPLTGTYRIFVNCTFANTSNDTAGRNFSIRASANGQILCYTSKAVIGTTLPVAGQTSVQNSLVCGLVRGDIITFDVMTEIVAGVTYLQGVALSNVAPYPVTAIIESFF